VRRHRIAACLTAATVVLVTGSAGLGGTAHAAGPSGRITGILTDDGLPVENYTVSIFRADDTWGVAHAQTGQDGRFVVPDLDPGRYRVKFTEPWDRFSQWAHRAQSPSLARTFHVTAGRDTVVTESLLPRPGLGKIAVTASDAVTGQRLTTFCVTAVVEHPSGGSHGACTKDGTAIVRDTDPGEHTVYVDADGGYERRSVPVTTRAGQTVPATVALAPRGQITTVVQDARTGQPVAETCVRATVLRPPGAHRDLSHVCSDQRGVVTLGYLPTGTYVLWADPGSGGYGKQWVGPDGGTGNQDEALRVSVRAGEVTTVPPIRLDAAGSVTGTLTEKATGRPVSLVCAFPRASDDAHPGGIGENCTEGDGRYTLGGLGPYNWPIAFLHRSGYVAWEWSGDAPHRRAATPVRVRAGSATPIDVTLDRPVILRGRITNTQGGPAAEVSAYVYSAATGDLAFRTEQTERDGRYALAAKGGQDVKIQFVASGTGATVWYGGTDFASATAVRLPGEGEVRDLDAVLPAG
jgi:5-hydroxyisourate hydrolase-like protein (transthyretin family)